MQCFFVRRFCLSCALRYLGIVQKIQSFSLDESCLSQRFFLTMTYFLFPEMIVMSPRPTSLSRPTVGTFLNDINVLRLPIPEFYLFFCTTGSFCSRRQIYYTLTMTLSLFGSKMDECCSFNVRGTGTG